VAACPGDWCGALGSGVTATHHNPLSSLSSFFSSQSIDLGMEQLAPLWLGKKLRACLSLDAEQASTDKI
jgi:hypothetical protein